MKISKSKQELARIISENGGWRDGAEWAAQDKNHAGKINNVVFYLGSKPWIDAGDSYWGGNNTHDEFITSDRLIKNWHQTIISREEYFHLYPAPDADGWIEWNGGECPVGNELRLDIKFSDGDVVFDADTDWRWPHKSRMCNIIAYRLHKPEQAKSTAVGDDKTNLAAKEELESKEHHPSIEQLMQIHIDRSHALSEKKAELLVAERQELEAFEALKAACREAGFDIAPITEKQKPGLVIADWRGLQVGDVIRCIGDWQDKETHGVELSVDDVEGPGYGGDLPIRVILGNGDGAWGKDFKFIRRP